MARIDATEIKVGDVINGPGHNLIVEWVGECADGAMYIAGHKSTTGEPNVYSISAGVKLDVVEKY